MPDGWAVYKYPLTLSANEQQISMPFGGQILHVHEQNGVPTLWVLVRPQRTEEIRRFYLYGTGDPIAHGHVYVGSVHDGPYVWHIFEVT